MICPHCGGVVAGRKPAVQPAARVLLRAIGFARSHDGGPLDLGDFVRAVYGHELAAVGEKRRHYQLDAARKVMARARDMLESDGDGRWFFYDKEARGWYMRAPTITD